MPHKIASPQKTTMSKAERARRYLSVGGVAREDSDDELGLEDFPWEWIYSDELAKKAGDKPEIVGARMGDFQCMVGDSVLLKAEGTREAWIGLICTFVEDDDGEKAADFMWFSTEREIRNKQKKRTDALPVCSKLVEDVSEAKRIIVRSLHYSFVGHKSFDVDQWKSFHRLGRDVQKQVSVWEGSTIVKRLWQDLHLPERLQHSDSYLHRRIRMGKYIQFRRRYTAIDRTG